MKPPESLSPDDPRSWLHYAHSDLRIAKNLLPDVLLEQLCFHAQQAAEKAIKALLIRHGVEFPYTHDLAALLALVENAGEIVPPSVKTATGLTPYAAATRYPGIGARMTGEDYTEAIKTAESVVRWVEERL